MANYENGASTRQRIIQVCKALFYEKGFHETGYQDICQAAHVNRKTIYYHFASKDIMRYEVQWEYITANKRIAEQYCPDSRYQYILAMTILWIQAHSDDRMRKFCYEIVLDYPVYTSKQDMTHFYYTYYEYMWGHFWEKSDIPELAFASVYGYIMSCMRMICEHPEKYDPLELCQFCITSSVSMWGIPKEVIDQVWQDVTHYLSLIPEEEMRIRLP